MKLNRQMTLYDIERYELIVDNFAGGGGASSGIEMAVNRPVDIAINHNPKAIGMHQTNHPFTKHYCEDVWEINPYEVTKGKSVGLAWFSPDCKHYSKARGGKPKDKKIRGLAWVAIKWAAFVKPRVIILENVEEFRGWGPLIENCKGELVPDPARKGETFNYFIQALEENGYLVEYRELKACDYGAPTSRKRFFLIARADGKKIIWPSPLYGNPKDEKVINGKLKPWKTAAEIIDWSIPGKSIFERKKRLAENTIKRIIRGIKRFIIENPNPFIVRYIDNQETFSNDNNHSGKKSYKVEQEQNETAVNDKNILIDHFISKYISKPILDKLLITSNCIDHHSVVKAFIIKYYGDDTGQDIRTPLHTITSKDRFGLITIEYNQYKIIDICLRMLIPRELFNAQGFLTEYIINCDYKGNKISKKIQVENCGNSVSPLIAKSLVKANSTELIEVYENSIEGLHYG
ncbi:DNA cytosine methyltransferase [Vallitalea guaymasensis]|uniref:DNA cytosine methyltransferase n=1 Tax=Vallitalea guaymasensis TaxID=1185412 RepID=UPI001FA908DF|nr:DNA cytosine methyltransferase [Vallitalea guaymasensis]